MLHCCYVAFRMGTFDQCQFKSRKFHWCDCIKSKQRDVSWNPYIPLKKCFDHPHGNDRTFQNKCSHSPHPFIQIFSHRKSSFLYIAAKMPDTIACISTLPLCHLQNKRFSSFEKIENINIFCQIYDSAMPLIYQVIHTSSDSFPVIDQKTIDSLFIKQIISCYDRYLKF